MNWCLCLLLASGLAAQQSGPDALATIEGRVVQGVTGDPLPKAHVTLELSGEKHDSALVATTDPSGRFRFADIQPGVYELSAEKTGFLEGHYGEVKPGGEQTLLRIKAGDRLDDLTVRLFPAATISGRVLDADGDPLSGGGVNLRGRAGNRGNIGSVSRAESNQAGEYRFDGLSSGTYYVSATAGEWGYTARRIPVDSSGKVSKVHDLTTFYPAALSLADAQGVTLENGQQQAGIDIRIRRGPTLSVKGRIAGLIGPASKYSLNASVEEGGGWASEPAKLLPNGEFVFPELPPGKHRLNLFEQGMSGFQIIGYTEINLLDQDLTGVVITPFKPAQVRVRVVMEGEEDKPLTTGTVFLFPAGETINAISQLLEYQPQNGTFFFAAVPPRKYKVWFNNATDSYLKSVQSEGRALDPESIDVADGAVLDLLMVFSKKVASVAGDVEISSNQPQPSVHVLLIAEEPVSPYSKIRSPRLDQTFHFSIANLGPGKYLAFAAEEDDPDLWENDAFVKLMQSQATEVELHESDHASVHLKLIPKDETDRARKQLGI